MKFALMSDIHGNTVALEAVLEDIEAKSGVDIFWVLGDLVALGPRPIETLALLSSLDNVAFVRGNTDRYVVRGERPYPSQQDVKDDISLLPRIIEVTNGFSWTQGMVTAGGWYDFLANLPFEQRAILPNGTKMLGMHAQPDCDDGRGVYPEISDQSLSQIFGACNADLIFVGHTHWPAVRKIDGKTIVNLGSVSNPRIPSLRATYVLLEANEKGYSLSHRFVDYDHELVIKQLYENHNPSARFVERHLRGEFVREDWEIEI